MFTMQIFFNHAPPLVGTILKYAFIPKMPITPMMYINNMIMPNDCAPSLFFVYPIDNDIIKINNITISTKKSK